MSRATCGPIALFAAIMLTIGIKSYRQTLDYSCPGFHRAPRIEVVFPEADQRWSKEPHSHGPGGDERQIVGGRDFPAANLQGADLMGGEAVAVAALDCACDDAADRDRSDARDAHRRRRTLRGRSEWWSGEADQTTEA